MGAAVSNWRLARAVAMRGQLGVVSGTAMDQVLVRRLQDGDPGGHMQRAISEFPDRRTAEGVLRRYLTPGGRKPGVPYQSPPMFRADPSGEHQALNVLANFVEVWLAREGHDGPVGINLLEKIAFPNLTALYGAMLAGVDYVLMGAGIPWQIPGVLDSLSRNDPASMMVPLDGSHSDHVATGLDPASLFDFTASPLKRPRFLAVISSTTLGQALLKRASGRIDGFVVEHWSAGGHNAPPRGQIRLNSIGEPAYGERDRVDLAKIRELGLPFWLAGGAASPGKLAEARSLGAQGVQVGTAFAFCEESGLDPSLRSAVLDRVKSGEGRVFTDPAASPTGFPFKVVELPGTLSDAAVYDARPRVCDLGFLRRAYRRPDGTVGYRCPAEPVDEYVRKGGDVRDTHGRKCLCNALTANIGIPQTRPRTGYVEHPLLTAGDDLASLTAFLPGDSTCYRADDVIDFLLADS